MLPIWAIRWEWVGNLEEWVGFCPPTLHIKKCTEVRAVKFRAVQNDSLIDPKTSKVCVIHTSFQPKNNQHETHFVSIVTEMFISITNNFIKPKQDINGHLKELASHKVRFSIMK